MQRTSGGKTEHTVVAPHKRIAIAAPHLAVNKLPRSLERDVHVAVDGLELTCATCQYLNMVGQGEEKNIFLSPAGKTGECIPL